MNGIGKKNPTLGEAWTEIRADYNAARSSRFRRRRSGVSAAGLNADWHYRSEGDFLRMMELSRDFFRNDVVVGQGIRRLVDNVLQDGFCYDPQTGDDAVDKDLWERWDAFSTDPDQCHVSTLLDWHGIERAVLQAVITDGDQLLIPTGDGPLDLVEAHRLRSPAGRDKTIVHGVEIDGNRRPLAYWVTAADVGLALTAPKRDGMLRYPARNDEGRRQVFHVYRPDRVSQTRGVTLLAPIADTIGIHDDVQFARLVQQQIVSCFAFIRQRQMDFSGGATPQAGARTSETQADGTTRTLEGIGPGMQIDGLPGEQITGFSPNVPNPEFFPHAMLILTFISINLNLPVAILLLDPSRTNFSGWRGAVDQARLGFRQIQRWLISFLHRPVLEFKIRQWAASDPILARAAARDGVKICGHRWNVPGWQYIEPLTDAEGDRMRIGNLLTSRRRLHSERGADWEEIYTEQIADNAGAILAAKKKAVELNAALNDGEPVHWRDVLFLPPPDGMNMQPIPAAALAGQQQTFTQGTGNV